MREGEKEPGMVNLNPAELRAVMDRPRSIRHMAVISPVDKARVDILTALVSNAGILSTLASNNPGLLGEEIAMCVESRTSISLYHEIPADEVLLLLDTRYRSLSLKLSDTSVYEPQIRARLGTRSFCLSLLLSSPELSDTHSLCALKTSPPRNCFTFLF